MTSDEFVSKYKLLKQITSEGGRSHTAVERASGRHVLAHYLDQASDLAGESLADLVAALSASDRSRILEVATVDGSPVVVTDVLENFKAFSTWLRSRGSAGGDFTQLFRASAEGESTARPAPEPPPRPQLGEGPEPAQHAAPGGFTELFRQQPGAGGSDRERTPAAAAGGFTELFRQAGSGAARPEPPVESTIPPVPLVSVRMGPLSPPSARPLAPPSARPPVPAPRLGGNFGGPSPAPVAAPPIAAPKLDAPDASPRPGAPPGQWAGPSDFTRLLSRSPEPDTAEPNAPAAAAPPPIGPAAARKSMLVPLLLALNLIAIVAVGLIVYFALKRS
jgi:hypothetical protein